MEDLLHATWGMKLGDWAKLYFQSIDAYNSSYSGVKADDFLDCWVLFDLLGVAKVIRKHYSFIPGPDRLENYTFEKDSKKSKSSEYTGL